MKVINSKKKFSGFVVVLDKKIFVNMSSGKGFYEIIKTMEPYTNKLVRFGSSTCPYTNQEDIKQNIYMFIIEGLFKYNPQKGASLSTFLYGYVKNKLIDYARKKDQLKIYDYEELYFSNIENKIDIIKKVENLDDKWKDIIFRIFINGDKIYEVSKDINMTPWGLTRAIRRKILET